MQALQVAGFGAVFSTAFICLIYGEILPFLIYRGVCYAKWVKLKSRGIPSWKIN
jgi:hypothetical protein